MFQLGSISSYVDRLLEKIKVESKMELEKKDPTKSALLSIKISIGRALEELADHEGMRKLLKTFTYFNETNMSQELLVACAETYIADFEMVSFAIISTIV